MNIEELGRKYFPEPNTFDKVQMQLKKKIARIFSHDLAE